MAVIKTTTSTMSASRGLKCDVTSRGACDDHGLPNLLWDLGRLCCMRNSSDCWIQSELMVWRFFFSIGSSASLASSNNDSTLAGTKRKLLRICRLRTT
eukprot:4623341-Lingulodinium_polyedra.AAC.1